MLYLLDINKNTNDDSKKTYKIDEIQEVTFKRLEMVESDVEDILCNDVDILFDADDDEKSLLIFARQLSNSNKNRIDLTALDSDGNIVIIEVKRDKKDEACRKEPIEFQAIRYASSFLGEFSLKDAKILYKDYISESNKNFGTDYTESTFDDFIKTNNINDNCFNKKQRIILVASSFNDDTYSAVTWLIHNNIDISCYQISPHKIVDNNKIMDKIVLKVERILPLDTYESYIPTVDIQKYHGYKPIKPNKTRRPNFIDLFNAGVIKKGDTLVLESPKKDGDKEAVVTDNGNVECSLGKIAVNKWAKENKGWPSINIFINKQIYRKSDNKYLDDIRNEYEISMQNEEIE